VTERRSLQASDCPVGRSVDVVGEWWSILIVRDAMEGITRFDDFRQHLGISPTMLTQRLNRLVETGIVRRRPYNTRPPRDEYVLSARGRELASVILALAGWWNDAVEPDHRPVIVVDHETGAEVEPVVVDRRTGQRIEWPQHRFGPGPTASHRTRELLASHDPDRAAS